MSGMLLIRADASTEIGTGHVMRCLALAQAWREAGGEAIFAAASVPPAIEKRLVSEDFKVERVTCEPGGSDDAEVALRLANERGVDWIVVDGYHFGADYQRLLKDAGLRVLVIDDNGHAGQYCADVVLNQNLHAKESMYSEREPQTRLLLGTRYALLRKEFWPYRGWNREIPKVARKVLVTMGGGDPDNVTTKVVKALDRVEVEGLEAVVVVGGSNPHLGEIKTAATESCWRVTVKRDATNMPELMAWADVAISAAGSTVWELAFMALPAVLLLLADNQREIGRRLDELGAAVNLEEYEECWVHKITEALKQLICPPERRRTISDRSRELVDGKGAERVVSVLRSQ